MLQTCFDHEPIRIQLSLGPSLQCQIQAPVVIVDCEQVFVPRLVPRCRCIVPEVKLLLLVPLGLIRHKTPDMFCSK